VVESIARACIIGPRPRDDEPKGFLWEGELSVLVGLLRAVSPVRMAETGVNTGRTAAYVLRHVPSIVEYMGVDVPTGYVTPLSVQCQEVPTNPGFEAIRNPKFRLVIKPRGSYDLGPTDLGELDAMFIDGDHSAEGVANDTKLALECVRPGGVVVWHDYYPGDKWLGVAKYLDELPMTRRILRVQGTCLAYLPV